MIAQPAIGPAVIPAKSGWFKTSPTGLSLLRLAKKPSPMAGLLIMILMILMAVFASELTPFDPNKVSPMEALRPPSLAHPMGTDGFGRDMLARVLYGARLSLPVGLISVVIGAVVGLFMGAIAGYWGGWTDEIISRLVDVMLAFPGILLALAVVAVLGPDLFNLMIAVGVSSIPGYARLVRAGVLQIKETDYVLAARALGCQDLAILFRHIMPNIVATMLVYTTLRIATAILAAASLNYLGMGAKPPTAEWGLMLAEARDLIRRAWWLSSFPGLAIMVSVVAVNMLGDGLRDAFDPWLKGK